MFDEIAKNIHYNNYFIDLTNEFIKEIDFNKNTCIQLQVFFYLG